ncbi:MAG TPA: hypothetical protein VLS46_01225, partial [Gaiellaceae bacterium]|nr:hypothetical protein [Gaiellaceae bacterium]
MADHDNADRDNYPEMDEQLAKRIAAIDEAEALQRANTLRAGLADYDLEAEDLDMLESVGADPDAITYLPAL